MTLKPTCLAATMLALAAAPQAAAAPTPQAVSTRTVAVLNNWIANTGGDAKVTSAHCRPTGLAYICTVKLAPPWETTTYYYRVRPKGGTLQWQAIN